MLSDLHDQLQAIQSSLQALSIKVTTLSETSEEESEWRAAIIDALELDDVSEAIEEPEENGRIVGPMDDE